jgi:hypothetical protein
LTACSSEELSNTEVAQQNNAEEAVAFSIYTPRTVTRAGLAEEITTASLKIGIHKDAGFGVFGYYTDGEDYASANTYPNFMYNQQVKWDGSLWKYEPVKYWPNEYGQSAISDDIDRVTFFSYAPWITVTPSTGVPVIEPIGNYNAFVAGLNIMYAKTTTKAVETKDEYIKYLAQNCYTGSLEDADLRLYINTTYNENNADIDEAINSIKTKNLEFVQSVSGTTVNTVDEYRAYIDYINGLAAGTTTEEIAMAKLDEINKQQFQSKNITALTKNNATGDPIAKYIVDVEPSKSVDLLWGVAAQDYETAWGPAKAEVKKNFPFIDLLKPNDPTGSKTAAGEDGKIKFNLRHALAQLNVTIDYFDDTTAPAGVGALEASNQTKIFIREIKIGGFTMKGALNLNNKDNGMYTATTIDAKTYEATPIPNWKAYDGLNEIENEDEEVWFKDGRRDGNEGVIGAIASNEKYLGLNPNLIQSSPYVLAYDANNNIVFNSDWSNANKGVTKEPVNLFGNDFDGSKAANPIYVIPRDQDMDIQIIYDVETVNPKVATFLSDGKTKGVSIKNDIRKTSAEVFKATAGQSVKMQAGLSYTIHLHIGMTSVKTDAQVQTWVPESGDAVLPENQPLP